MIIIPQWVKSVIKYLGLCVVYGLFSIITASICSVIFMKVSFSVSPFYGFLIAAPIVLPCIVLITLALILLRRRYRVVIFAGFVLIFVGILVHSIPDSPSRLFRRVLVNPIPNSVSDIKVDRIYIAFDHIYVLSFNLSEADFNSILTQKRFKRLEYVDYDVGTLHWSDAGWNKTFPIYKHRKPPLWFDLKTCASPQMYEVEIEDGKEQYLIFNKDKGHAFLIDYKWK